MTPKTYAVPKRIIARLLLLIIAVSWALCGPGLPRNAGATNDWQNPVMADYVKVPPFVSYSVKPNIMIILDNSGSMNELAYPGDYAGEPYNGTSESIRSFFVQREADNVQNPAAASSDQLELGSSRVGLYFSEVDIPQGAVITEAYIRFTAMQDDTDACTVAIYGEASDDAASFVDDSDIDGRISTTATVPWTPGAWSATSEPPGEYDTPDISAILQEIVSRTGWLNGQALVLGIAPGTGERIAQAHLRNVDDSEVTEQYGPVLHVKYETVNPGVRYYGYYNPDYFYKYNSNAFFPEYEKINYDYAAGRWNVRDLNGNTTTLTDAQIAPSDKSQGLWDGNWANWLSMRRIDVMRKVLMGGKATSRTGGGNQQNIAENGVASGYSLYTRPFSSANGPATSPYNGNFSYMITRGGDVRAYYTSSSYHSYKNVIQKDVNIEPEDFHEGNLAGVLQRVGDRGRWGNLFFNYGTGSGGSGGNIAEAIDNGFNENMLTDLQNTSCNTWTPLAESYYVAMQYFRQEAVQSGLDYPNTTHPIGKDSHKDPFWDKGLQEQIPCAKSFVLLLTDGASTMDTKIPSEYIGYARGENIPENLRDYAHFDPQTSGTSCSTESSSSTCVTATSGTDYLADLALYARTNDLRPDIQCWDNNLVLYPIFAFGVEGTQEYENATTLLKKAALLGGFGDSNDDGTPDTYYEASDGYALEKNLLRAIADILARTSSGTAASVVSNSRSGEGAVYQSIFFPALTDYLGNTVDWAGQVNALLVDAYGNLREDTTGDRRLDVAQDLFVVFGSETPETEDGCPPKEGEQVKVRKYQDVNANQRFDDADLEAGPVSVDGRTELEMHEINYLWTSSEWLNSNDLDPVTQRTYNANTHRRHILTFVDADGSMVPNANNRTMAFAAQTDPTWEQLVDPQNFFAYLHTYEPFNPPIDPTLSGFKPMVARQAKRIVNYIRGQDQGWEQIGTVNLANFRNRRIDHQAEGEVSTWRMGDIVHSSPTVVGRPAENFDLIYRDSTYTTFYRHYRNRRAVLYVGSNGGMLHALNAGFYDDTSKQFTERPIDVFGEEMRMPDGSQYNDLPLGAELWGYVPFNLLPHLYWLTKADYEHVYYMDLEPRVFDARIFNDDDDHPSGWGTVLVAGMRFGGGKIAAQTVKGATAFDPDADRVLTSAYAVFDVTNPEKPPRLLAELTFPELGFTTCHPGVIAMRELDENDQEQENQWYLIFGSGPVSPDAYGDNGPNTIALTDGTSTQNAVMYAVDLAELAQGNVVMLTPSGDGATTTAYSNAAGAGPFYMVQFNEPNSSVSKPVVLDWDLDYKADTVYFGTSSGDHTNGWSGKMRRLVLDDGANDPTDPGQWRTDSTLLSLMAPIKHPQMSTGQPIMAPANATTDDDGNRWVFFGTGRFLSQADKLNADPQSYYGIKEPFIENADNSKTFTYDPVAYGDLFNASNVDVYAGGDYLGGFSGTFGEMENQIAGYQGWRLDFPDTYERNLGQAVLAGQALTFTTFTPSDDICASSGVSHIYALYFRTGTAYKQSIFGVDYNILSPDGDPLVLKRRSLGPGLTITPNVHTGRQKGTRAFIQTESGSILDLEQQTPGNVKSGKIMWRPDSDCPQP